MNDGPLIETADDPPPDSSRATLLTRRSHLFLVMQADDPVAGGARYSLDDVDEVIIGRGIARQVERVTSASIRRLMIHVPGQCMSAEHVRLSRMPDGWLLNDAGSKNGTFIDGQPVTSEQLPDGSLFDAGHALFLLHYALPTPADTRASVQARAETELTIMPTLYPAAVMPLNALAKVACSYVPILLVGESGTGKELLANRTHTLSQRRGSFVAVNCGGLAATLVESLLFGHVKGAFSGAGTDALGLIRAAHHGTLFLDEIGCLPLGAQATLLRVLQEHEVIPVGATRPIFVDFRVVCATNQSLDNLVDNGRFRMDLLNRIDGFRHTLVPLRARKADIGIIIAALLNRLAPERLSTVRFSANAMRKLVAYDWPGNIRELEQALARALAQSADGLIRSEDLGLRLHSEIRSLTPEPQLSGETSDPHLREELISLLATHNGSVSQVARSMGKARMQIQRWMRRFEIDPNEFRQAK